MFQIIGAMAEFERSLIQERIKSGLRRAVTQGKRLGRPRVTTDPAVAHQMHQDGRSLREIALSLSIGKGTVERLLALSQKPLADLASVTVGAVA